MKTKEKGRIQVGIDKELKENAEQILEELGLNATTAITILYKQVVSRGEFPMEIKLSEEEKAYILSTPPRSEINDFIWRKYNIDTTLFNQ